LQFNENDFKSGSEFLNDLEKDEIQNRQEFASNQLTALADRDIPRQDKWWDNAQLNFKL